ncbi:protein of unknown function [Methylorubrum extorquens]|uniref:SsuA/THI5-like domain-containing protein n=1 Tax=Methylorubrum extorquens TaxID=408 RepID=A0A2N9AJM8_METEX|nr:protein of unknown function [Methylorubrum extorquens]
MRNLFKAFGLIAGLLALPVPFAVPLAAQTVPVRIGVIPVIGAAPVFVANGEGWLKEAGLAPAFTTFESGPNMIQALASGTIDVYVAGIAPLAVARTKGIDVRVVAATAIEEMVFVAAPQARPLLRVCPEQGRGLQAVQGQGGPPRPARHAAAGLGAEHYPPALALAGGEGRQGRCRDRRHGNRRDPASAAGRRRRWRLDPRAGAYHRPGPQPEDHADRHRRGRCSPISRAPWWPSTASSPMPTRRRSRASSRRWSRRPTS